MFPLHTNFRNPRNIDCSSMHTTAVYNRREGGYHSAGMLCMSPTCMLKHPTLGEILTCM
jgi:hypothetical protein